MSTIHGTYHAGRVELDSPVDWPDGHRVEVIDPSREQVGRSEEDWPDTPEGREALVARFDAIGPIDFTREEPADRAEVDWPDTPEDRERQLALLDSLEPLEFTPEEEADLAAFRAEVREVTLRAVRKKMGLE